MIFFNKEVNLKEVFNIDLNTLDVIKKIVDDGEWTNPPKSGNYYDKVAVYSYLYAKNQGLKNFDLTGFVTVITALLSDVSASFGMPRKADMDIENKAIDFLNSLSIADKGMDENKKAIALVHFVWNLYNRVDNTELIQKTVLLTKDQSDFVKQYRVVNTLNFSHSLREILKDYMSTLEKKEVKR